MTEQYRTRMERRKVSEESSPKKQPRPKKAGTVLKRIFLLLLTLGIIGIIAGAITFFVLIKDAPPLDEALLKDPLSSTVYDINGNQIYELGEQKREHVSFEEIPDVVKDAFIATEDVRFYKHHGMDVVRIGGAVVANVKEGFGAEGASTITQQVVKNTFFKPDKTIKRKVQELWLSFQLEQKYSKQEILEMYLNKIYFSEGSRNRPLYGIGKAAEEYFGIKSDELEKMKLHQAALLAGMPQSPNNYNPFKNPEAAEKRRNVVLTLMAKHGFISQAEADSAKKIPVTKDLVAAQDTEMKPYDAFIDQVKKEIYELGEIDIYKAGLEIHTTLDPNAQNYVDAVLNGEEHEFLNEKMQAGIAVLDTKTGEIRALGGGRPQKEENRINFAIDPLNQPGSTIKPILDYGPAVEYENWSTYEQIKDEPYKYSNGTPINNFDFQHKGMMSARDALAESRNIPALKAMQAVGLEKAQKFAVKLGMPFEDKIYESYSIGGVEEGVSPLQMAGAYSAFGNKGVYIKPHAVKKIVFPDNTEMNLAPEPKSVMKDSTAFIITDMLRSVVDYGTGRAANIPGRNLAGKTGTTNFDKNTRQKYGIPQGAVPDAWFTGYTPEFTAAVWTGFRNGRDYMETTAEQQEAKKLFKKVMTHVTEKVENTKFKKPNSVEEKLIEKGSFPPRLASKYTPKGMVTTEYYVKGTAPKKVSEKYKKLEKPDLQISYNEEVNQIELAWDYPADEVGSVSFEISQSVDGSDYQLIEKTQNLSFVIPEPAPGSLYKYQVVAVTEDSKSAPAAASIQIPAPVEEEPVEEEAPPETEDPAEGEEQEQPADDTGQGDEQEEGEEQGDGGETSIGEGVGLPPDPNKPEKPGEPGDSGENQKPGTNNNNQNKKGNEAKPGDQTEPPPEDSGN